MAVIHHHPIILASGSTIRQQMLKACGLTFSVEPSALDEEALVATLGDLPVPQKALTLARAKAQSVSEKHPGAYVIGADQMCCQGDTVFSKPETYERAQAHLTALAGRMHQQNCGAVIALNGQIVWELAATATLTMRALTPEEIRSYVSADAPLAACGAYKFESLGRHLFSAVEGDHDVIKGLPLVPLLNALHAQGVIALGA